MRPITAQGTIWSPAAARGTSTRRRARDSESEFSGLPVWLAAGVPFTWVSRRVLAGRGEGSSGLRFDVAGLLH
jgi:hypothetical protein